MSAIGDPAKLKVAELRQELKQRGLDSKGNKPVLVTRLKKALAKETQKEFPDTSIADTSTEELDSSQDEVHTEPPDRKPGAEDAAKPGEEQIDSAEVDAGAEVQAEEIEAEVEPEPATEPAAASEIAEAMEVDGNATTEKPEDSAKSEEAAHVQEAAAVEVDQVDDDEAVVEIKDDEMEDKDDDKMKDEKEESDEVAVDKEENANADPKQEVSIDENKVKVSPDENDDEKPTIVEEHKGEKRKRSSSPERSQRRRSRSPHQVREDEPPIDTSKVQLNWYDCDLHLQVDKETFLSASPYHEGAFGYVWAGARATHGVRKGKVRFEVKITEELKWEDIARYTKKEKKENSRREGKQEQEAKEAKEQDKPVVDKDIKEETEQGDEKMKEENADEKTIDENEKPPEEKATEKSEEEAVEKAEEATENVEVAANADDAAENVEEVAAVADDAAENGTKDETEAKPEKEDKPVQDEPMEVPEESMEVEEGAAEKPEKSKQSVENNDDEEGKEQKEESAESEESAFVGIPGHIIRVGWSLINSPLQLGENPTSYAYESLGKFVTNKQFVDYGRAFGVGDVIGAYIDINDETVSFTFTVNGESQSVASTIPRSEFEDEAFALFPHVLTRNYAYKFNMGDQEEPWFPNPETLEDYECLGKHEDKVDGPVRPEARKDCEVIMMCGLPAAGKTHWVRELVKSHPEKRYNVIGNSHLLEKMTVNGNPLKLSYKGRWNMILDKMMKCLNKLVDLASVRRRNFIIDQTNVFPSAQRRKMRTFEGFRRKAVVVVSGEEEHTKRRGYQEAHDGKDVPESAVLEMKANMRLPRAGEFLDEVIYTDLQEEEAKVLVQKFNQQGRDAGFGPYPNNQSRGYNRGQPYRWDHSTSRRDYRGGYNRDNRYYNNRYDRNRGGSSSNRRPAQGSWNRDVRRDSRGPPSGGPRDWRNNNRSGGGNRSQDRNSRDNRNNRSHSAPYNRQPRSQPRNQPPAWQNQNQWQAGQGQGPWEGQGAWGSGQAAWSNSGGGGSAQGHWNQGQWKSGGGYNQGYQGNYGGGYANWNYYGQYPQNWSGSQGSSQTTSAGDQYSQQAAWAQYAQQYAHSGLLTNPTTPTTSSQLPPVHK